jgi:hypothetical protein
LVERSLTLTSNLARRPKIFNLAADKARDSIAAFGLRIDVDKLVDVQRKNIDALIQTTKFPPKAGGRSPPNTGNLPKLPFAKP